MAKGKHGKESDVDVAFLAERALSLEEKVQIGEEIANRLGVSADLIDLVDLRVAPPLLQHEVATKGKLLFGSNDDFLRFKVLAWKRYLNTAKFRLRREQALEKQLAG